VTQVEAPPVAYRPTRPPGRPVRRSPSGFGLGVGFVTIYLSLIVLIPLGAVVARSNSQGLSGLWHQITQPDALSSLRLTVGVSALVSVVNAFMGTLIAWTLVRDRFPGQRVIDALIDLPFALPTIVAGLVLLALYGPTSAIHLRLAYTRPAVVIALLFVTLPFVVRSVQPVLMELDQEMEEAAKSLGAGSFTTFRRVVLPNLVPAILAGTALSFARAISEFGSTVLISGNIPNKTEVAAVHIYSQIQSDNVTGAAALSTLLLLIALVVLAAFALIQRWATRRG
jgi:sulfate transport system permease protein